MASLTGCFSFCIKNDAFLKPPYLGVFSFRGYFIDSTRSVRFWAILWALRRISDNRAHLVFSDNKQIVAMDCYGFLLVSMEYIDLYRFT